MNRWIRWAYPVMFVVVLLGGFAWENHVAHQESSATTHSCSVGGFAAMVEGQPAMAQDGGQPGHDGCDLGQTAPGGLVIGFDCKVRDQRGTVLGSFHPNHADGTCGNPDSSGRHPLGQFIPA